MKNGTFTNSSTQVRQGQGKVRMLHESLLDNERVVWVWTVVNASATNRRLTFSVTIQSERLEKVRGIFWKRAGEGLLAYATESSIRGASAGERLQSGS